MTRKNKTTAQQNKYYEVENIYEYMVDTHLCGNKEFYRRLFSELNYESKKMYFEFIFECISPDEQMELLKDSIPKA